MGNYTAAAAAVDASCWAAVRVGRGILGSIDRVVFPVGYNSKDPAAASLDVVDTVVVLH